jgi:heme-degrading monooxygenase HmoA
VTVGEIEALFGPPQRRCSVKIVLFHIQPRDDVDEAAYGAAYEEMLALVAEIPGYLGIDGFSGEDGSELAIARFDSDASLTAWRELPEHRAMQERGRREFFASYHITVTDLDQEYRWPA